MKFSNQFDQLNPETILQSVENIGLRTTGRFTQLNSYENRVFSIEVEADLNVKKIIVKFYRPGRWNTDIINEEFDYINDLIDADFKVAQPFSFKNDQQVFEFNGFYYAVFPFFSGRMPDELLPQDLKKIGTQLAILHQVGQEKNFKFRPVLGFYPDRFDNLDQLTSWIAPEVRGRYLDSANKILEAFGDYFDPNTFQRIHGDCHRGNIINTGNEFSFVDFDDCCLGPRVQDFWMLLGDLDDDDLKNSLIDGYEQIMEFPFQEMKLIPLLQGLRIINYSWWISQRWSDNSFPRLFPDFRDYKFWAQETESIEKIAWSLNSLWD